MLYKQQKELFGTARKNLPFVIVCICMLDQEIRLLFKVKYRKDKRLFKKYKKIRD